MCRLCEVRDKITMWTKEISQLLVDREQAQLTANFDEVWRHRERMEQLMQKILTAQEEIPSVKQPEESLRIIQCMLRNL